MSLVGKVWKGQRGEKMFNSWFCSAYYPQFQYPLSDSKLHCPAAPVVGFLLAGKVWEALGKIYNA